MGATSSTFKKDLKTVNSLVDKILKNSENKDINCDDYTIVLESSLKKHLKLELEDLKDNIYIIPKQDTIMTTKKSYKKRDLCKVISNHYLRIIKLVKLIKDVYDLENDGKHSIAGICIGNISIQDKIMRINYCETEQKDYDTGNLDSVNFSRLAGLTNLCTNLLDEEEKNIILTDLNIITSKKDVHSCNNKLFNSKDYNNILGNEKNKKNKKCQAIKLGDFNIKVVGKNPVISNEICMDKRFHLINLNRKNKDTKFLMYLYNKMHERYNKNLEASYNMLFHIINIDKYNNVSLKNIGNKELDEIERIAKYTLTKFYLESIVDYQKILEYALGLENLI